MKVEKQINYLIAAKIFEIAFVVIFIFLSFFLMQNIRNNGISLEKSSGLELNFTGLKVENPIDYPMYPMSNLEAMTKLKDTNIIVENNGLVEENFNMLLQIRKTSSLDYHALNIAVDDRIFSLSTIFLGEDEKNYNFLIVTDKIKREKKEYKIKIWLDETVGNEMQNKQLTLSFELEKAL